MVVADHSQLLGNHSLPQLGQDLERSSSHPAGDFDTLMTDPRESTGSTYFAPHFEDAYSTLFGDAQNGNSSLPSQSAATTQSSDEPHPFAGPGHATNPNVYSTDLSVTSTSATDFSPDQLHEIYHWMNKWRARNRPPSTREAHALAILLDIDQELLVTFIGSHTGISEPDALPRPLSTTFAQPTTGNADEEEVARVAQEQVADYARHRNSNSCSNMKSMRAPNNKLYKCTTIGCHYSTNEAKELTRHLQTKWPQEFWHCILCRRDGPNPSIRHRRGKMIDHLKSGTHNIKRDFEDLCDQSAIAYSAEFPRTCPFFDGNRQCNAIFLSWTAYKAHILAHWREQVPGGQWQLYHPAQRRFDDDDDGGSGTGSSSRSGRSLPGLTTNGKAAKHSKSSGSTTSGNSVTNRRHDNAPSTANQVLDFWPPQTRSRINNISCLVFSVSTSTPATDPDIVKCLNLGYSLFPRKDLKEREAAQPKPRELQNTPTTMQKPLAGSPMRRLLLADRAIMRKCAVLCGNSCCKWSDRHRRDSGKEINS